MGRMVILPPKKQDMKPKNRHSHFWNGFHRWAGLIVAVIILIFSVSGIILNHRDSVSGMEVSRDLLPQSYRIRNFNNGTVRGTLTLSSDSLLVFGNCGVWLTDKNFDKFYDYNSGFPEGVDNRNIRNIVKTLDGEIWCATQYGLYKLSEDCWSPVSLAGNSERLSDVCLSEDSCRAIAVTRSQLYVPGPSGFYEPMMLARPEHYDEKITLFKTIWHLHSGELFGITGKIVADIIALILIFLSITGILVFILPYSIRKRVRKQLSAIRSKRLFRWNFKWHNSIGYYTLPFAILIVFTGMCLRPPLMIPFVMNKTVPIPGTDLDDDNCWHDKLRALRWDKDDNCWLLSTAEGFYKFRTLTEKPVAVSGESAPPVSPMGITVFQKDGSGNWLIGSFSGLYRWNPSEGIFRNYFTDEESGNNSKKSFVLGNHVVSGFTDDTATPIVFDYAKGAEKELPRSRLIEQQPMSLWNFALELHVGRCYSPFLGPFSGLFVFVAGLIILMILISGFIISRKHKHTITINQSNK